MGLGDCGGLGGAHTICERPARRGRAWRGRGLLGRAKRVARRTRRLGRAAHRHHRYHRREEDLLQRRARLLLSRRGVLVIGSIDDPPRILAGIDEDRVEGRRLLRLLVVLLDPIPRLDGIEDDPRVGLLVERRPPPMAALVDHSQDEPVLVGRPLRLIAAHDHAGFSVDGGRQRRAQ